MPTNATPILTAADELFELSSNGSHYELIRGSLRMMSPAGGRHGRLAMKIAWLLNNRVLEKGLGVVLAAETGFRIESDPDTVIAPDVSYVERSRYDALENEAGFLPFAPDFAVEVISPSDRFSQVESKAILWLDAGCKLVLLVDTETATVHAYRSRQQIQVFRQPESCDCNDAAAGWTLRIEELFRPYEPLHACL